MKFRISCCFCNSYSPSTLGNGTTCAFTSGTRVGHSCRLSCVTRGTSSNWCTATDMWLGVHHQIARKLNVSSCFPPQLASKEQKDACQGESYRHQSWCLWGQILAKFFNEAQGPSALLLTLWSPHADSNLDSHKQDSLYDREHAHL